MIFTPKQEGLNVIPLPKKRLLPFKNRYCEPQTANGRPPITDLLITDYKTSSKTAFLGRALINELFV
jgi:hypothetical protein